MDGRIEGTQGGKDEKDISTKRGILEIGKELFTPLLRAYNVSPTVKAGRAAAILLSELMRKSEGEPDSPLDRLYAKLNGTLDNLDVAYGKIEHEKRHFERNSKEYINNDDETIVFLPWETEIETAENRGFIPRWGRVTVFTTPGGFVNKDPKVTKGIFLNVIQDAKAEIAKILAGSPGKRINVFAYSAANGFGFYTANTILDPANKGDIGLFGTGSGLGEEIFGSPILGGIKKDAMSLGIPDGRTFNNGFSHENWGPLLPIDNCDSLPNSTTISYGNNDIYILPKFGREVATKASESNSQITTHRYPFGHIGTCVYSAHMVNLKRMKSVIEMSKELTDDAIDRYDNIFKKRNLELPKDDVRIWAAVFTILCRASDSFKESKLVKNDEGQRTIEEIAQDFLTGILPEANKEAAVRLSKISNRTLRGRIKALQ